MNNLEKFSTSTVKALKYYVYALVNPIDNQIFYIGKGKDNRVFAHQNDALKNLNQEDAVSLKLDTIKNIISNGYSVKSYIIRHFLEEKEALELEAILIDVLTYVPFNLTKLTNLVKGHNTIEKGISSTSDIETQYSSQPITANDFQHNVLILNIGRTFYKEIPENELYEATRKASKLNLNRVEKIDYVIARSNGILREIYKPTKWYEYNRDSTTIGYAFDGFKVNDENIRRLYINKSIKGTQNPVNYIENKQSFVD